MQWLWTHPTLRAEILALLEAAVVGAKKATGRTGMDLWQILVLGVARLGLDADWDRLEHIANYDSLVRQMLGVPATPWGADAKGFARLTLRDNVALIVDELLHQINACIAAAGREVFAKKGGAPVAALNKNNTPACIPRLGFRLKSLKRGSRRKGRTRLTLSSEDPSSPIRTSKSRNVWARMDSQNSGT